MITSKIRIYTYKGKSSKKYYKIAYFGGQYNFVHISKEKISKCKQGVGKDGKKYLEYIGDFTFDKVNKVITV